MSVRVRLTRVGSKKNPIWRVVVADQRSPRDGRFIEAIGHYNPQTEPSTILIDEERLRHWLERGAQPTGTVKQLMKARAKSGAADATTSAAAAPAAAASAPAEPAPDEPASAEAAPAEAASTDAAPGELASAEPAPDEPAPE
jgi:small subunit ribosomal protein S16